MGTKDREGLLVKNPILLAESFSRDALDSHFKTGPVQWCQLITGVSVVERHALYSFADTAPAGSILIFSENYPARRTQGPGSSVDLFYPL